MLDQPIWVQIRDHEYPIFVGSDLLTQSALFSSVVKSDKVFILTHQEIANHYLAKLTQTCVDIGVSQIDHFFIPTGEAHKSLASANQVFTALLEKYHHRDSTLIALGGGMIGDLAGFCAACYMRGIDVIQCPTSLLAQVDAAIGGKTAVNHPLAKNVIGAFHQPRAVMIDIRTLATLPKREYVAGLAELIKYAITLDSAFFCWLENHIDDMLVLDDHALTYAIKKGCQIKADIVAKDEKEQGLRMVLNFGHTFAHALESLLNYQQLLHGEAVAIGMVIATHLSMHENKISADLLNRLMVLLERAGLPTTLPSGITIESICAKMKLDKKNKQQKLNFVLLEALGGASIKDNVSPVTVENVLCACST